jgi:hypothetical protein
VTDLLRRAVQAAVLAVAPHGGQLTSRRNAWAGMSTDAARARARREADIALAAAAARVRPPADPGATTAAGAS